MSVVLDAARNNDALIRAVGAPYDLRETLKQRKYKWRPAELPNGKVWWIATSDPEGEIAWLREEIYDRDVAIPTHAITAFNRYSDRLWDFS